MCYSHQAQLAQHRQGKGSIQAAACLSWAQPYGAKGSGSLASTSLGEYILFREATFSMHSMGAQKLDPFVFGKE